jgi:hypothetical protein
MRAAAAGCSFACFTVKLPGSTSSAHRDVGMPHARDCPALLSNGSGCRWCICGAFVVTGAAPAVNLRTTAHLAQFTSASNMQFSQHIGRLRPNKHVSPLKENQKKVGKQSFWSLVWAMQLMYHLPLSKLTSNHCCRQYDTAPAVVAWQSGALAASGLQHSNNML